MRTPTTTNRRGGLVLAGVAAVALMGGSAFTASITGVDGHTAGAAAAAVSGITVTGIEYNLDHSGTGGTKVTSLTFPSADVTAATVGEMSLSGGAWKLCSPDEVAKTLTCPAPDLTLLSSVSSIDLVVTSNGTESVVTTDTTITP